MRLASRSRGRSRRRRIEHLGRCLQVDHEIGRRDVRREQIVEPLIDEQLVVVEIQIREDLVLVEQVVADRRLREQIACRSDCCRCRFSR